MIEMEKNSGLVGEVRFLGRLSTIIFTLILSILFIFSAVIADDEWAFKSKTLEIDIELSGEVNLIPNTATAKTESLTAELTLFPRDTWRQQVDDLETYPTARKRPDQYDTEYLEYSWSNPEGKLIYQVGAKLSTKYGQVRISDKVRFPLSSMTDEAGKYLDFTENIDEDETITNIAQGMASGEDDLYVVVHKIAEWLKINIEYDLSYADKLDKASTTIMTRAGVCDEVTSLFIAMLRSIGVPAKYSSGYAYTNLKEPKGFGPHAWAEVFFPGFGWVPFDITYNEFGYVDATHIKMKDSADSGEYSTRYQWRGRDVDLVSKTLQFHEEVTKIGGEIDNKVDIELKWMKDEVGFGSYNLLEVTLSNLNNYYNGLTVYLTKSGEVDVPEGHTRDILLKPFEVKTIYWIVHLTESLDTSYQYAIPMGVYMNDGKMIEARFEADATKPTYEESEMQKIRDMKEVVEEKVYSKDIEMDCQLSGVHAATSGEVTEISTTKNPLYVNDEVSFTCTVKNTGNVMLEDLEICYENLCQKNDLAIAGSKSYEFKTKFSTKGQKDIIVTAANELVSKYGELSIDVDDYPQVELLDMTNPDEVTFDDRFMFSFIIGKQSESVPKDVLIKVTKGKLEKKWEFSTLSSNRKINLEMNGYELSKGRNEFNVSVDYKDDYGNAYASSQVVDIDLVNLSFREGFAISSTNIGSNLSNADLKIFIIVAFAFGGLCGFAMYYFRENPLKKIPKKLRKLTGRDDSDEDDGDDVLSDDESESTSDDDSSDNESVAELEREEELIQKEEERIDEVEDQISDEIDDIEKEKALLEKERKKLNEEKKVLTATEKKIEKEIKEEIVPDKELKSPDDAMKKNEPEKKKKLKKRFGFIKRLIKRVEKEDKKIIKDIEQFEKKEVEHLHNIQQKFGTKIQEELKKDKGEQKKEEKKEEEKKDSDKEDDKKEEKK